MDTYAFIAIFEGKCKAIAAESIPDLNLVKKKWISQGADEILKLPTDEAKQRFLDGLS